MYFIDNPKHTLPSPASCNKEVTVGVGVPHGEAGAGASARGRAPTYGLLGCDVPDNDPADKSASSRILISDLKANLMVGERGNEAQLPLPVQTYLPSS